MPKFKVVFSSHKTTEKHTVIVDAEGIIEAYMVAVKRLKEPELNSMDLMVLPYAGKEQADVTNIPV